MGITHSTYQIMDHVSRRLDSYLYESIIVMKQESRFTSGITIRYYYKDQRPTDQEEYWLGFAIYRDALYESLRYSDVGRCHTEMTETTEMTELGSGSHSYILKGLDHVFDQYGYCTRKGCARSMRATCTCCPVHNPDRHCTQ